jgi:HSP20 family molecular chaperone IbpA
MKKRSFFERLAGNLRFDDNEEEIAEEKVLQKEVTLPIKTGDYSSPQVQEQKEEIGELPVDVYETSSEVIIQTLIAGVLPENLSISITRDTVIIKGKREENRAVSQDQYVIKELYWGSFARTVGLPTEVEIDTSEAIERHGMLMIKLPKTDRGRKTVLKIKSI